MNYAPILSKFSIFQLILLFNTIAVEKFIHKIIKVNSQLIILKKDQKIHITKTGRSILFFSDISIS